MSSRVRDLGIADDMTELNYSEIEENDVELMGNISFW